MKPISEAIGNVSLRSVIFSGVVLACALHPFIAPLLQPVLEEYVAPPSPSSVLFVVEAGVLGLLVSGCAVQVLFLYEGLYFPGRLTRRLRAGHERRVARMVEDAARLRDLGSFRELPPELQARTGLLIRRLLDYPNEPSTDGMAWRATAPTLLGNIVATYEAYARTRHGVDSELYWGHLLALAPEPARTALQQKSDVAESLVLASFAAGVAALFSAAVLIARGLGVPPPHGAAGVSFPPASLSVAWLGTSLVLWRIFYWQSLEAFRQVGRAARTLVDLAVAPLRKWIEQSPPGFDADFAEKAKAFGRFLRFLKVAAPTAPTTSQEREAAPQ